MSAASKPVHEAWADVMADVEVIGKNDRNTDQNFMFRGVDATVNAVAPILRRHRVFVLPRRIVDRTEERYETRKGTQMRNVTLTIEWEIRGPAGDTMPTQTCGEAADSGDKAVSKAHSVAYRTLFLEALCVPTGDRDPDSESHERATSVPDSRREGWQSIEAKGRSLGMTPEAIRADYLKQFGHEIDGPEATVETLRKFYESLTDPWTTPARSAADAAEAAGYDPMGLDGGDK